MKILILPTWYPNCENSNAGIFVKNQVDELSKYEKNVDITVCYLHKVKLSNFCRYLFPTVKVNKEVYTEIIINYAYLGIIERIFPYLIIKYRNSIIKKNININEFDLIHAHVTYNAGYDAYLLGKQYKKPFIITEHMGPFPFDIPLFIKSGVLTRYLVEPLVNASRVVAVSNYLANKIMSFNITRNIDIIPNIILQKDLMSSKSTNERVTFICVANLIREKGIIELLNAVKLLSLKKLEFTVQILGSGVLYDEIYHFIKVHSLQFIVYLLGSKTNNEVLEMISNADIFVLPSYQETFGVVYAEAISLGKPVIATKCGGPEDIINEINGVFCDIGDSSDLAKKMEYMYYNYQSYDAFKIKNSFMDKFSSSKICNKIFKVYNEVINQCVE